MTTPFLALNSFQGQGISGFNYSEYPKREMLKQVQHDRKNNNTTTIPK